MSTHRSPSGVGVNHSSVFGSSRSSSLVDHSSVFGSSRSPSGVASSSFSPRMARDSERRFESTIRSTRQKMDLIQMTHNPDPVERRMASMRFSSEVSSGLRASSAGAAFENDVMRRVYADIGSNKTSSRASATAPSASASPTVTQAPAAKEQGASLAAPSIKKKVSGAVVSRGFVLDSKGLRPHEVCIPFVPPANYCEARHVGAPATRAAPVPSASSTVTQAQAMNTKLEQSIASLRSAQVQLQQQCTSALFKALENEDATAI